MLYFVGVLVNSDLYLEHNWFGSDSILHKSSPEHINHIEHHSRNNSGGLEELNVNIKNECFSCPRLIMHIKVYWEYLTGVSSNNVIASNKQFYLQSIEPKPNRGYWFSPRPLSRIKPKLCFKKIVLRLRESIQITVSNVQEQQKCLALGF